jgi:hypothetical protein
VNRERADVRVEIVSNRVRRQALDVDLRGRDAERPITVRLRAPARGQRAAPGNRAVGIGLRVLAGAGMRGEEAKDGRRGEVGQVRLFDPPKYTPRAGFACPLR